MNRSSNVLGTGRPLFVLIALGWPLLVNAQPSSRGEGAARVTSVACGSGFSCALQSDGLVACWGDLNPPDIERNTPFPLEGLDDAVELTSGQEGSACARRRNGEVSCWGSNAEGQLGRTDMPRSSRPVPIPNLKSVKQVSMGQRHGCAVLVDGRVMCWGDNVYGQLGRKTDKPSSAEPIEVDGARDFVEVAAGWNFSCGRKKDGTVWCWGGNGRGEMGEPSLPEYSNPPTLVKGVHNATSVAAGLSHTCAVLQDGTVQCWGWNNPKGLLSGRPVGNLVGEKSPPVTVVGVRDVTQLALGNGFSCALTKDARVSCWGGWTKMIVPQLRGIVHLAAGAMHACAVNSSGEIQCWGDNSSGQLGTPRRQEAPDASAVLVAGLPVAPYEQFESIRAHEYIVVYRDQLLRELKSEEAKARVLAIDVKGTGRGDARELTLLARDYSARKFFPRYLVAFGRNKAYRLPKALLPIVKRAEGQLKRTKPTESNREDLVRDLDRSVIEEAQAEALSSTNPEASLLIQAGLVLAMRVEDRANLLEESKTPGGDWEVITAAAGVILLAIQAEGEKGPALESAIELLKAMAEKSRDPRRK
ncbi:MAG: RCC1 domain-containing protein [Myxococcota bacterium]